MNLGYFLDAPWENIPEERKGAFISCNVVSCGLLGGAPTTGKESKLAALARARKERKGPVENTSEQRTSVSLLSRLTPKHHGGGFICREYSSGGGEKDREAAPQTDVNTMYGFSEEFSLGKAGIKTDSINLDQPDVANPIDSKRITQETTITEPLDLKAVPSNFAQSMFGERITAFSITLANGRIFNIAGTSSKSKIESFTGPSPDDVVVAAQSNRGMYC